MPRSLTRAAGTIAVLLSACSGGPKPVAEPAGAIHGMVQIVGTSRADKLTVTLTGPANASAVTDGSGAFAFAGLPDGRYLVSASAPSTREGLATAAVDVAGGDSNAGTLTFLGVGSLIGRALLVSAEVPLGGTLISAAGAESVANTDASGTYVLHGLRPGHYVVQAFRDGFSGAVSGPVEVRWNEAATVPDLQLGFGPQSGTASISGTLQLAGAAVPASVSVSLVGPHSATTSADATGAYSFSGLPPGRYVVGATLPSTAEGTLYASVIAGSEPLVAPALHWTAVGDLSGSVTLAGAADAGGTLVTLPGTQAAAFTDGAGRFTLRALRAGAVSLQASRAGYLPQLVSATVGWNAMVVAPAIDLPPAGSNGGPAPDVARSTVAADSAQAVADGQARIGIAIRLLDRNGAPVAGQLVSLTASDPSVQFVQPGATDQSGTSHGFAVSSRAVQAIAKATVTVAGSPTNLLSTASVAFVPGAPARLAFATQPISIGAGGALPVAVQVLDRSGNLVSVSQTKVQLSLFTGAAALLGTPAQAASAGTATFGDLTLHRAGTGYTLAATAPGLDLALSAAFDVAAGPPVKLGFVSAPATATAGTSIGDAAALPLAVAVQDQYGNTAASPGTVQVSVALAANGSALQGAAPAATANGVAVFPALRIDVAATGYVLTASAAGYPNASTPAFEVRAAAPATIAFGRQPQSGSALDSRLAPVAVALRDAFGNTAQPDAAPVSIALSGGSASATLLGTDSSVITSAGREYQSLVLHTAGEGYTLVASAPGLSAATSDPFAIAAGPYVGIGFVTQPPDLQAGTPFTVAVGTVDLYGNPVTNGPSGQVRLSGPVFGRASLSAGLARFPDLNVTSAGSYSLSATFFGPSTVSTSSRAFQVTPGPAAQLSFDTGIDTASAGQPITSGGGPVRVAVSDQFGNAITAGAPVINLALGQNTPGDTLQGTLQQTAASGVALFNDLKLIKSATDYTLVATTSGLSPAVGNFAVNPGPATSLGFGVAPVSTRAASFFPAAVSIELHDSYGNAALSSDPAATQALASLTLQLTGGSAGARLNGKSPPQTDPSLARISYPALQVDRIGTAYKLSASAIGFPAATSAAFDVTAPAWTQSSGIEGGSIGAMAIDPALTGGVWAGAGSNIFHSSDSAQSWSFVASFPGRSVVALAVDKNAPQKIFAQLTWGTYPLMSNVLVRSLDSGANWTEIALPQGGQGSQYDGFVQHVLVFSAASAPSELYVGAHQTGLLRTTDDGATFTMLDSREIWAVGPHPTDPSMLFMSDSNHVWRSTDRAASWTQADFGLGSGTVISFAWDPFAPGSLLAVGYPGVFLSKNADAAIVGQVTFTSANLSRNNGTYTAGAYSATVPGEAYVINWGGGNVNRSADHGLTFDGGTNLGPQQSMLSLAVDPATDAVLVGHNAAGVVRSADAGAHYAPSTSGMTLPRVVAAVQDPVHPLTVYAATGAAVFRSQNGGASFAKWSEGLPNMKIVSVGVSPDGANVYATGDAYGGPVARRASGSASWSLSQTSLYGGATLLAFDAVDPTIVYAINGWFGDFFKSTDSGLTFTNLSNIAIAPLLTDPKVAGRMYFLTNQILISTNYGATWVPAGGSFTNQADAGALSSADTNVLFLSVNGHVYRSTDGGATFAQRTDLPGVATAFALDPANASGLFAATGLLGGFYGAIYSSADAGGSWTYAGSGLGQSGAINLLLRDSSAPSALLVATESGLFRTTTAGQ